MTDPFMNELRHQWIADYQRRVGSTLGRCQEAAREMHAAFPDLRIVKGHALTAEWGARQHFWLEEETTPEQAIRVIYDPTENQFPSGVADYVEYRDGQPLRVGKCMDCGETLYAYSIAEAQAGTVGPFCGPTCERAYAAEVNGVRW